MIQVGDRVLAINHQKVESLTTDDLNRFLLKSRPKVTLQIEFDVAESVIASSGTFTVKLEKKGPGLGITITGEAALHKIESIIRESIVSHVHSVS